MRLRASEAAAPLVWGAIFAWIELAGGWALGPWDSLARAESLFFLICRPWVLILAALCAGHWTTWRRILLYAAMLATAAAGETAAVLGVGATDPWPEMLRGLALGIVFAAGADAVVQALRRRHERLGALAALVLLGGLVWLASGTRAYEAALIGPTAPREVAGPRPPLLLMTGLPIVWGAGGAFDPNSRPAESYRALEREFQVTAIDAIEPRTLRGHRLMLIAQPRRLAPEELVALDEWVRAGGRLLVLTDPDLVAARAFPFADLRRPPEIGLLGPLLSHWGLGLEPGARRLDLHSIPARGGRQRLLVKHPGRLAATGGSCRTEGGSLIARCRLRRGEALVVADADLLMDEVWAPAGPPRGHERHLRLADNPLVVAGWLDGLAGLSRERSDRPVAWLVVGYPKQLAIAQALIPGIAALSVGFLLFLCGRSGRRRPRVDR